MPKKKRAKLFVNETKTKKVPIYFGRKMIEVKKYPNFILFEDPKTKVRSCFLYEDLGRKGENLNKDRK